MEVVKQWFVFQITGNWRLNQIQTKKFLKNTVYKSLLNFNWNDTLLKLYKLLFTVVRSINIFGLNHIHLLLTIQLYENLDKV